MVRGTADQAGEGYTRRTKLPGFSTDVRRNKVPPRDSVLKVDVVDAQPCVLSLVCSALYGLRPSSALHP
jgi:hypothetical protein